jgi:hypothetical protein
MGPESRLARDKTQFEGSWRGGKRELRMPVFSKETTIRREQDGLSNWHANRDAPGARDSWTLNSPILGSFRRDVIEEFSFNF